MAESKIEQPKANVDASVQKGSVYLGQDYRSWYKAWSDGFILPVNQPANGTDTSLSFDQAEDLGTQAESKTSPTPSLDLSNSEPSTTNVAATNAAPTAATPKHKHSPTQSHLHGHENHSAPLATTITLPLQQQEPRPLSPIIRLADERIPQEPPQEQHHQPLYAALPALSTDVASSLTSFMTSASPDSCIATADLLSNLADTLRARCLLATQNSSGDADRIEAMMQAKDEEIARMHKLLVEAKEMNQRLTDEMAVVMGKVAEMDKRVAVANAEARAAREQRDAAEKNGERVRVQLAEHLDVLKEENKRLMKDIGVKAAIEEVNRRTYTSVVRKWQDYAAELEKKLAAWKRAAVSAYVHGDDHDVGDDIYNSIHRLNSACAPRRLTYHSSLY